jgi:hypothetical protein
MDSRKSVRNSMLPKNRFFQGRIHANLYSKENVQEKNDLITIIGSI